MSSSKYKPVVVYILCGVHIQTFALMLYDLEGISSSYSMWCVVSGRVVYYMTTLFYYDLCSSVHYYWNVLLNEQLRVKSVGSTLPIPTLVDSVSFNLFCRFITNFLKDPAYFYAPIMIFQVTNFEKVHHKKLYVSFLPFPCRTYSNCKTNLKSLLVTKSLCGMLDHVTLETENLPKQEKPGKWKMKFLFWSYYYTFLYHGFYSHYGAFRHLQWKNYWLLSWTGF